MRRVYLDSAATTPTRPEVAEEMARLLAQGGNPSVMYASGRRARKVLEDARARIAECVGARPEEIFFTSGGTESDNWALRGAVPESGRLVVGAGEHRAVLDAARAAPGRVARAAVDGTGAVTPEALKEALCEKTDLVSIMHASNEVGTVNPIGRLSAVAREAGALFHTDAVASAGKIRVRVDELGVDLLSASAHKFYGPPGVGFLYVREGTSVRSLLFGGSQERKRRPGTENVPGAAGMALALVLSEAEREEVARTHLRQTERLRARLSPLGVRFCGDPERRLPGLLHFLLPGTRSEAALIRLDREGFECAAGAACSRGAQGPSHALLAMGVPPEDAERALRVSLGRDARDEELDAFAGAVERLVADSARRQRRDSF